MNQSLQGKTGGLRLRHHGAGRRDVGGGHGNSWLLGTWSPSIASRKGLFLPRGHLGPGHLLLLHAVSRYPSISGERDSKTARCSEWKLWCWLVHQLGCKGSIGMDADASPWSTHCRQWSSWTSLVLFLRPWTRYLRSNNTSQVGLGQPWKLGLHLKPTLAGHSWKSSGNQPLHLLTPVRCWKKPAVNIKSLLGGVKYVFFWSLEKGGLSDNPNWQSFFAQTSDSANVDFDFRNDVFYWNGQLCGPMLPWEFDLLSTKQWSSACRARAHGD